MFKATQNLDDDDDVLLSTMQVYALKPFEFHSSTSTSDSVSQSQASLNKRQQQYRQSSLASENNGETGV